MNLDWKQFFTMIIYGAPGSGKTNLLKYIVYSGAIKNEFDHCILLSANKGTKQYDFIDKKYKFEGYNLEIVKSYIEFQKKKNERGIKSRSLIIFDDVMGEQNFRGDHGFWKSLFSNYRHWGINVVISMQTPIGISSEIRGLIKYACVYRYVNENDLENIFRSFGSLAENKKAFYEIYKKHTDEQYKFLFFNKTTMYDIANAYVGCRAPKPSQIPPFILKF